ncbi:cytochrome P450 family protein [Nocardia blacklockiae]|uniref:cytochrome P450 family protein n=1 Tax=Nocardia blacklockiae TaxID=480036 RepID=UPI0018942957|nr:cytochrome P450 [Nocardia blacklockiae]MBF6172243.1 cytochrome P450 [Nocardia blacklockiae]
MTEAVIQLPTAGESVRDTYARIRAVGEIVPIELPGGVPAFVAVSYRAVSEVLDDKVFGKSAENCPALRDGTIPADWPLRALTDMDHMLNKDGLEHRRLRKTIGQAFTPARIAALEPRIEKIAANLMANFPEEEVIDLVAHFTTPLPVRVICELFGVPAGEQGQIKDWTATIVSATSTGEQAQNAMIGMLGYFTELLERKRREPADDLTTALLAANEDNNLTVEELVNMLWLVIVAGHETTVHLLSTAVVTLCTHPEQRARATEEARWADVVEEALRYGSPVVGALMRYPRRDVTIAGVEIPAGSMVLWHGGVGRDARRYPDADTFDIDHDHRDQLGFGRGPHFCLGAPLARLESRIALSMLFNRFPRLELACDPAELAYVPQISTTGPIELPVRLDSAR